MAHQGLVATKQVTDVVRWETKRRDLPLLANILSAVGSATFRVSALYAWNHEPTQRWVFYPSNVQFDILGAQAEYHTLGGPSKTLHPRMLAAKSSSVCVALHVQHLRPSATVAIQQSLPSGKRWRSELA